MKTKRLISFIAVIGLISPMSLAQTGRGSSGSSMAQGVDATTVSTSATTTTTLPKKDPTIQTLGEQGEKNTQMGTWLGIAAVGVTSAGVGKHCPCNSGCGTCYAFVAGLVASIGVTYKMMSAAKGSSKTVPAVTVGADPYNLNPDGLPGGSASAPRTPDFEGDPDWKSGQKTLKALKDRGFKIDPKTGAITTPDGKVISATTSAAGMQAQGLSSSDIKAFEDAMKQVPAKAQEKFAKGTDSQDMFGDSTGGGSKPTNSASGMAGFPGLQTASTGPKLGIDRDPAQVAGMKKMYNGEPIGVSADSVFLMIDRRYDLHREKGSFLLPSK